MKCRLCKRDQFEIKGYLKRVNALGEIGIWECRPSCNTDISNDEAVLQAITEADQDD